MNNRKAVFDKLDEYEKNYEVVEHPAVFTIGEMDELRIFDDVNICKNLFVRNGKGDKHYLIVLCKHKQADLKQLAEQLGESRLSFASEERLAKHLRLSKGEVTPLAVINDKEQAVVVVFDSELTQKDRLGVHPNDNTAAVCGLFCGTCPSFPDSCHGCLSEKVAVHCRNCPNGIRECAIEHAVTRCYECGAFPCDRLEKFSGQHYQNGIGHHENVIKDLQFMREHGVEEWVKKQTEENTCSKCDKLIYWYDKKSHVCR